MDTLIKEKLRFNITPDDFDYLKVIGRDNFGKVSQVRFKFDGKIYALKSLKKNKLKEAKHIEHMKSERKILEIINHPFIVSLIFAFQTVTKLYLVMEYHNGGDLFYHLRRSKRFNEKTIKFYMAQIVLALEVLHSKKIIYRDLKPENIVLTRNGYIKLTGFGLAKDDFDEDKGTQTFCGTSPEIIRGEKYGKSVDIWCIGILMYEMFFGYPPFQDKNKDKLYKKIIFNEADLNKSQNVKLTTEAIDLISKLLDKNPKNRLKIAEIKSHAFFDDLDFEKLIRMELEPPMKPNITGDDDYKYIDPNYANDNPEDSLYTGISLYNKDFTYQKDELI